MADNQFPVAIKVSPKVLIACDDAETASVWIYILQRKGLVAILEPSLDNIVECWEAEIPDLVVIDLQNAQDQLIEACQALRGNSVMPILLFLPANNESQIIEAYQAGVDECVIKPISPAIFTAKIMAWARRSWTVPVNGLDYLNTGKLTLDPDQRAVVAEDGAIVRLTNMEFRLLHFFMTHPSQVLETSKIVRSVWGSYGEGDGALLKNVVYRLRRKIESDPSQPNIIKTWPGGYSFNDN